MTDLGDFDPDDSREDTADDVEASGKPAGDDQLDDRNEEGGNSAESSPGEQSHAGRDFERVQATPVGSDRGIGALAVSKGLSISEDPDNTTLRAYVTGENRSAVRIGTYLLASYPDGERLFCRITGLEYTREFRADDATEIHARRAMRREGIDEADYKFLATLAPVAVLYEQAGELKRRMTDRVPKPETVIRQATDPREIKTGLKIPEDGVFLGHLSVGGEAVTTAAEPPTIDYRLRDADEAADPLVFRHTLIAGGTGSGKTHAAKNVLRQYLGRTYEMDDSRTPALAVVQFDPQDEYSQMHDDNPAVNTTDERRWQREHITHGGHEDTVAFVPEVAGASYAASHHHAEQVSFSLPFSLVQDNPWLVAGGGLNENQYAALTDELIPRFFRQYGPDGTYQAFLSYLDDPGRREDLDESGVVHEATFNAVKRRVRGFDDVFDGDTRPITDLIHEFIRPGGLTVVPTYHVSSSRATAVIVLALSSLIVDAKLSNDPEYSRIKQIPLVVGLDEAHNFLTDADTAQARRVIGKFTEAAKQGRKERLGLFLVTQDPQDIADPVFTQVNTRVVLNLGDEDAIDAVNIPKNMAERVPYMEQGQRVVYSPDNSEPVELIGLPKCVTKHES